MDLLIQAQMRKDSRFSMSKKGFEVLEKGRITARDIARGVSQNVRAIKPSVNLLSLLILCETRHIEI